MVEVLNYVAMADSGFSWVQEGRPVTLGFLEDLQGRLMRGTDVEVESGRLRTGQVVIGRRDIRDPRAPLIESARFVPAPPGDQLRAGVRQLLDWMAREHTASIDPVVAAGMAHYQFETLHPFRDGNGRLGRYLIVLSLLHEGVLSEPTLAVSPWFEACRTEYYDSLLAVSTDGDWDRFLSFFAQGLTEAATTTRRQMLALAKVQERMKEQIAGSPLRSAQAPALVDIAVANPTFTVKRVEEALHLSYSRANGLVAQLVDLGMLTAIEGAGRQPRRFVAPEVLDVLLKEA